MNVNELFSENCCEDAKIIEFDNSDRVENENVKNLSETDQVLELSTAEEKDKHEDVKKGMFSDQEKGFLEQLEKIVLSTRRSYQ